MWTAAHAHKPLPGSEIKWKPNLLLSDEITANWGNIRVSAELTYSVYQPVLLLVKVADTHAYLMLSEQPWRCFALVLSLTNEYRELRVLFYDHAGGVMSPTFNIHQQADILAHIIAVIRFGSLECIGYDSTVSFTKHVFPSHHHTNNYHPIKNLPTRQQLADHTMTAATSEPPNTPHHNFEAALPSTPIESISADLEFESESHTGFGTYVSMEHLESPPPFAPQEPDSIYTATPHPSQFPYSTQSPELCGKICVRDTIYTIKRILFASCSLVSHGTVCYLVTLDDEEFIIKDHLVQGKEDQVALNEIDMLKCMFGVPGVPELVDWWIVERSNGGANVTSKYQKQPQHLSITGTKFVKALRDIIIIQHTAVEEHKVLHHDCSLNNAMIEFAVHINPDLKYAISGTGTIPFMSWELLTQLSDAQQVAMGGKKPKHIPKTSSNTLDNLGNTIPDHWNNMDLESCTAFKGNFFTTTKEEHHLVEEIHPYFKDLIPLAKEWCTALKDNMENPMLKESAALLTHRVEKCAALQSFSVGLPKRQRSDVESDG
ncbi:hypothetical protein EDB19DRAFT_1910599 [Suillus lakei]|nr:hypothetical protein EDB19DRAFT_1910599 [Suillus lakei]